MEGRQPKVIYVDIDGTICSISKPYSDAQPILKHIDKINKLYDDGNTIIYYTARGAATKVDYTELTKQQLKDWRCKFHDLFICDKSIRIEEL
jgi:uncharacterized HAD superfamily protein